MNFCHLWQHEDYSKSSKSEGVRYILVFLTVFLQGIYKIEKHNKETEKTEIK